MIAMVGKDEVMARLGAVAGPDNVTPLPQSGALSDVIVQGGKVYFSIAIDPARAGAMAAMRDRAEAAVKAIAGVESGLSWIEVETGVSAPYDADAQDAPAPVASAYL